MDAWLKAHLWPIAITVIGGLLTMSATSSLYGYRIGQLEEMAKEQAANIQAINAQQVQLQIQLAQIQVDLSYIKASIDRFFK